VKGWTFMKTRELQRLLEKHGYKLLRAQKHYFYSNGIISLTVPRHKEVQLFLARKIIKQAGINL
jgi:predicted RNA binding protein YcfA (HicA-like mRNA interferase family)